jgi:ssDNA-binding Zn-finger/Zn-ribbon topoisomerase 1
MGELTTFRCPACRYTSGQLALGAGREARGLLGTCPRCRDLGAITLRDADDDTLADDACRWCDDRLTPLAAPACPRCGATLDAHVDDLWD